MNLLIEKPRSDWSCHYAHKPHSDGGDEAKQAPSPLVVETAKVAVGVIHNPRSRHNRLRRTSESDTDEVSVSVPLTKEELLGSLRKFAEEGRQLLVIDGGDGTVRDVLSLASSVYGSAIPPIAVLPAGKTNALARDLGIASRWGLDDARKALTLGHLATRTPIEVRRPGQPSLLGFILGLGSFVRATDLAQRTHAIGAFNGLAVGLSVAAALLQTIFGRSNNPWRSGVPVEFVSSLQGKPDFEDLYLILASTLHRLPLGMRPFGPGPSGLSMLAIEAPPRLLPIAAPAILAGVSAKWLSDTGYHQARDLPPLQFRSTGPFVLDGESFSGGLMEIRAGNPVQFVVP